MVVAAFIWWEKMIRMLKQQRDVRPKRQKAKEETQRREEHVVIFRGVRQSWEIYVR